MGLDWYVKELQSSTFWHYLQDWSCRSPLVTCPSTEKVFCVLKKNNKIKVEKVWEKKITLTIVLNRHISENELRYHMIFKDWLKGNEKSERPGSAKDEFLQWKMPRVNWCFYILELLREQLYFSFLSDAGKFSTNLGKWAISEVQMLAK